MVALALAAPTFARSSYRLFLVLHALTGMALLGASTHLLVTCIRSWVRPPPRLRLLRLYSFWVGVLYLATFVVGLLQYPTYRYVVRGLYLDRYEVWASNLFDIKENLVALGLPFAVGMLFWRGGTSGDHRSPDLAWATVFSAGVWAMVTAASIIGFLVTTVHSA